jgi:hypothetical protein
MFGPHLIRRNSPWRIAAEDTASGFVAAKFEDLRPGHRGVATLVEETYRREARAHSFTEVKSVEYTEQIFFHVFPSAQIPPFLSRIGFWHNQRLPEVREFTLSKEDLLQYSRKVCFRKACAHFPSQL